MYWTKFREEVELISNSASFEEIRGSAVSLSTFTGYRKLFIDFSLLSDKFAELTPTLWVWAHDGPIDHLPFSGSGYTSKEQRKIRATQRILSYLVAEVNRALFMPYAIAMALYFCGSRGVNVSLLTKANKLKGDIASGVTVRRFLQSYSRCVVEPKVQDMGLESHLWIGNVILIVFTIVYICLLLIICWSERMHSCKNVF